MERKLRQPLTVTSSSNSLEVQSVGTMFVSKNIHYAII